MLCARSFFGFEGFLVVSIASVLFPMEATLASNVSARAALSALFLDGRTSASVRDPTREIAAPRIIAHKACA